MKFLLLASVAQAIQLSTGTCALSLEINQYNEWHDIGQGFIYALFQNGESSIENCFVCKQFGMNTGAVQMAISDLESARQSWISQSTIDQKSFFPKIQFLMGLYLRFYAIGWNI